MAIPAGTHLGPYEVLAKIGAGGMGEVYRARDTRLKRDVALKVIPDAFAHDHERMARFTREAQLLASLNHLNIAAIYGVEETGDHRALVLELIDGDTLADRIARGPLPAVEAIRIALQIAEALEAAHERNIIHRDLKPANIKINSQGIVKVLDFGLARALADPLDRAADPSNSPTMTLGGTRAGVILGTAGYMAPEQARGRAADRRADNWAFGVVLFEILTGRRAFAGETASDTLAKVLEREPDWESLPAGTPAALRRLVQHCLKKNVRDRLQAIGDARTTLQEILANPAPKDGTGASASPRWTRMLPWAIAPVFLATGWLVRPEPAELDRPATRFEVPLPAGQFLFHQFRHPAELSPDGTRMAFVSQTGLGPDAVGRASIYVRSLDLWDATMVPGTEGGANPFFSPDGKWLGFVTNPRTAGTELKKVLLSGGAPVPLAKPRSILGATWGPNGQIVFAERLSGLKVIRDVGGDPEPFTELNPAVSEVSHRLPHFLPDGSAVLFTVLRHQDVTPNWKQAQIWAKSLKTGERTLILENGVDARYAGKGWLVFARLATLYAVRFDPVTLVSQGSPVPVLENVLHSTYTPTSLNTTGAAGFSIANNGSLLYAPGSIDPLADTVLHWSDRQGTFTPVGTKPRVHLSARLSPDNRHILFNEYSVNADIWIYDMQRGRGSEAKQTFEGQNAFAIWSPDGSRIAFRSDRSGPASIYVKPVNSPDAVAITSGQDIPGSWKADKQELAFVRTDAEGQTDIWVVSVDQPDTARPLLATRFLETYPEFSPNGRWLAYCSNTNDQARPDVFVRPYPGPGEPVQISIAGGVEPAWSRDGNEIFYRSGPRMFSVRLRVSESQIVREKPVQLFEHPFGSAAGSRSFDVALDGRFLVHRAVAENAGARLRKIQPSTLRVILNWTDEFRRNVGK